MNQILEKLHEPSTLLLVLVAVTAAFLMFRSNRYYSRQRRNEATVPHGPHPSHENVRRPAEGSKEIAGLEVQLHETARALSARLDTKMSALQALIAEADRAAARVEAALAKAAESERPAEPASRSGTQAQSLQYAGAIERLAAESAPRPRRHEEIYTLADNGFDSAEIARRIGTPVGEIELILSLRGKGG
jgi:hypothetical protein